jgi:prophage tail gpP-like protein
MSDLDFKISGQIFSVWEKAEVFRTMAALSGSFAASTSNFFDGDDAAWQINVNDPFILQADNTKLLTGYLDDCNIDYGPEFHQVMFKGRDKTSDLIDCSYEFSPNEWKGQTIQRLFEIIAGKYSIAISVDDSVNSIVAKTIPTFKADEGDMVSDILSRLCKDYGFLAYTIGDGKLLLTSSSSASQSTDPIILGQNATRGSLQQSNKDRYSEIHVKGVGNGSPNKGITDFTEPYGMASDGVISRTRPLVVFADGPTDSGVCRQRAKWESMLRAGYSRRLWYTIPGWEQSDGKIWDINSLVRVKDSFLELDTTMLIDSIRYVMQIEGGQYCLIGVVHKDTYTVATTAGKIKMRFDG